MNCPRPEHPRPQFQRENWINLNGNWEFEIDNGRSGEARGLLNPDVAYADTIVVPFCPESRLSGVQHTDFMYGVWYRRRITLTEEQLSGLVLLHFGAVDYRCTVYVNGQPAGHHIGGYTSFMVDITPWVQAGENVLTVFAEDDTRDRCIPSGKQSDRYNSYGCFYTRTTGIWQTVWLECVPETHIAHVQYYPDIVAGTLTVTAALCGIETLTVEAFYEGRSVGIVSRKAATGMTTVTVPLSEIHLWEPGHGRLYDLTLTYGDDRVSSYCGLRQVTQDGERILINGRSVFMRLVLDQGFYPDGVYTAPSDEDLLADIRLSKSCGFNGARLHEKIFEERFLYHCDREGYLVWGERPCWGAEYNRERTATAVVDEWVEEIRRDFNHPSLIGWCPFNEAWVEGETYRALVRTVYAVTKALDPTRLFIDASGGFHELTEVYDVHDYDQNPETFRKRYEPLLTGEPVREMCYPEKARYTAGMPWFVSEMGGIGWTDDPGGWGYGQNPTSKEEFIKRFTGLCQALLENKRVCGLCYTQLTDVEQEQNGLFRYDRTPKFDCDVLRAVLSAPAAIEQKEE